MALVSQSAACLSSHFSIPCDSRPLLRRLSRITDHSMPDQPRRRPALRRLASRTFLIGIFMTILGIAGVRQANAQGEFIYDSDEVTRTEWEAITNSCGQPPFPVDPNYNFWLVCANIAIKAQTKPSPKANAGFIGLTNHLSPQANPPFALTLSSGTPYLPFLGNSLVEISFVPNAADLRNTTAVYATTLRRQADCSLNEDFILPTAATPGAASITSLPGAQDYLHQLSGLTTTPDVFAHGCDAQVLGQAATGGILLLGQTSTGEVINAQLTNAGLYVTITDPTANTYKSTLITSGPNPGYFSAASLRKNGIMDLVETGLVDPANSAAATAVLLGNGDGTFQNPVYYDVADTSGAQGGFVIDDVTGDGIPDIVVLKSSSVVNTGVPTFTGTITTLIGKGDGAFATGPVSNVTWTDALLTITGDFNGDHNNDLLIGGTVLVGAGDGSFTQGPTNQAIAGGGFSGGVYANAVGSLRNNGKVDVVVTEPGYASIFYGNGDGTFQTGPSYAALPDFMQVTITDIDGDGNPDIFLGTSTGGVYTLGGYDTPIPMYQVLMGRGDGTFVDSQAYIQSGYRGQQIASADFNGDSKLDVMFVDPSNVGGQPSSIVVLPGDGKGNLGAAIVSSANLIPTQMISADMNGDGKPDVVFAGSVLAGAQLSVLINQGDGTFTGEKDYALPAAPVSLAIGDFNGDGRKDVAVGVSGGVYVLLGQINGKLGSPTQIDSSLNPTGLAAASLTSDGRTDLIVADQGVFSFIGDSQQVNGALHVYLGNADGTFTAKAAPTTTATNYSVAALGDLNQDGKLDLIVAGNVAGTSAGAGTPNIYTLLGNGDGTFQAANTVALAGPDGIGATSIDLADFNKDGRLDVVAGNANDVTELLFGNGDGTLIDSALALGQRPGTVAAADLLGNGYPEILVGATGVVTPTGSLTVLLNQPTGWATTTTTAPTVTVTPSPASITSAQSTMVTVTVSGGSGSPRPTGSVTLTSATYTSAATTLSSGSATITVPGGSLATAIDTLTATYTPDSTSASIYTSATGTGSVTVTAAPAPGFSLTNSGAINVEGSATTGNTSTITVTPSNGFTGAVNLTCAVTTAPTGATSPATCGVRSSVTIAGITAQNATLTVTTTSATTAGAYAVTVTGADGSITQMTIVSVNVTAYVAPTFALTNSGNITVIPGATTGNSSTISVTPSGGFTGAVALTCAIAPAAANDPATCALSPASVAISGATARTSILTVATTAATTAALDLPKRSGIPWYAAGGSSLACVLFLAMPARRRRWRMIPSMILLFACVAVGLVSCGGGGSATKGGGGGTGNPGTTAGTYTVTVSGNSGSATEITTVTLTVN
jgi:hypothetical protein